MMKMFAPIRKAVSVAIFLLIFQGCASLGLAPAKSFSDRLAYGYGTVTALRNVATQSLNTGAMSSDEGMYVLKITDESRTVLDAARNAYTAGRTPEAERRLTLTLGVLDQLQNYLAKRTGRSP